MADTSPFLGLVHNAALLLTIAYLFDVSAARWKTDRTSIRQAFFGIVIGTVGIIVMMTSWTLIPGLIFDTRSVLLCISGLFFGFIPTVIAMVMTVLFRVCQGGPGAVMGVSVIIATGTIGILWRRMHRDSLASMSWRELYLFGIAAHLVMLGLTFTLPLEMALRTLSRISLPVLLIYPAGTALLGMLMVNRLKRQRAVEDLQESEERYRSLFDYSRDAILLTRPDGSVLDANPAACRMFDRSLEEIRSIGREGLVDAADPRLQEALQKRKSEGGGIAEITMLRAGGDKFPAEITSSIFTDAGGQQRTSMIIRDVTERGQAEESLRQSEDKFTKIFMILPNGVSIARLRDGQILETNDSFKEITGWDRDEVLGRSSLEIHFWNDPADRLLLVEELNAGRDVLQREFLFRRKDGTVRIGTFSARFIRIAGEECIVFVIQDITERKETEKALQESEEKFARVFRMSPDIMTITRLSDNVYVDVNDEFTRQSGYAREEAIGRTPSDLAVWIDPSDRERMLESIRTDEELQAQEHRFRRKNGTIFTCEMTGRIVTIGGERCLLGMYRNVTEKIEAERAQRESEEKFRSVVENSLVGIAIIDDAFRYVYVNEEFCRIAGYSEQELIGDVFTLPLTEGSIHVVAERYQRRQRGEEVPSHYEFSFRQKNGSERVGEVRSSVYLDSTGSARTIIQVIDITDRKKTEESLLLMQFAMDNAPDSVLLVRHDGGIEYANEAACTSMGYTREELLGMMVFDIDPDFSVEGWEQHKINLKRFGRMTFRGRHRARDGRLFPVEVTTNFFDYKGDFLGIAFDRDITERLRAEEEKHLLEERLNRAEKMEALGKLAGGVAHDLNNTLGVVIGYTELLLNSIEAGSPVRTRLTNIMQAGGRAAAIVQDLLTLARRGVAGKEVLNLNRIVADFQNSPEFEKLASYHPDVRFRIDLEPDLPNLAGSSVHLVKTLFNLVSNAVEAMPGGGPLTVSTANHYLDKPLCGYEEVREGDYVLLAVSDSGEGISAADLPHIFEPFYTKKVMGRSGTGLGLSVVWGTVKDHDGYVNVQSEEGKGSTFTLYFPVTREELPAAAVSTPVSEYMGREESILVVDDIREQRELAAELLRGLHYRVDIVSCGEDAVDYLRGHKADLVLLDMIMDPGMDGLDTYRHILEINPKQKAIIVSGFSETDRVNKAQALGAGEYVRKPYVIEKLGLAVRRELDRTA
jgi:PAS domain S-box-containing protein